MLTLLAHIANFPPMLRVYKLFFSVLMVVVLQSCYTMLYPPQTQPETLTTMVSEPAMRSTFGGAGAYGWDPYWEPALPFTSYYSGYGASYYSPYNYYDYHHPHYAPVYVVGESATPEPARDFNRDDKQGGSRLRVRNDNAVPANISGQGNNTSNNGGLSTAAAPIVAPVKPKPAIGSVAPIKNKETKAVKPAPKKYTPSKPVTKPSKSRESKPVKSSKQSKQSESPASKKRTRTRK